MQVHLDSECIPGKYDDQCTNDCSDNCKDNTCMKSNGQCIVCVNGKYGGTCNFDCSDNCKDKACMKDNGYCLECNLGKHGNMCELNCSDSCTDKNCMKSNGHCIGPKQPDSFKTIAVGIGIGSGVVILALVVLVIILVRRLSTNKGDNMNSTSMADLSQSVRQHELHSSKDDTYDKIGAYTTEPPIQTNTVDENYEQLDPLKREPAHVYETTTTAVL
ncbi:uncharacterized protein LOC110461544 [Mizuhopecten yessoensis]|uniref:uncharacterized protein LOC110461544 n=1 Tax=Mizuhopecten yessoensis TaxID=6573 RepID=UPI000B45F30B|nr:uncharacterized protein LOC110461544 [Mizuhopecten yessoensis]